MTAGVHTITIIRPARRLVDRRFAASSRRTSPQDTRPPPMYVTPESLRCAGDPPSRCDVACQNPCGDGDFQDFLDRARSNTSKRPNDEASAPVHRREEEAGEVAVVAAGACYGIGPSISLASNESTAAPAFTGKNGRSGARTLRGRNLPQAIAHPSGMPDNSSPPLEVKNASAGAETGGGAPFELQEFEADRIPFLQRVIRVSAAAGNGPQTIRMRVCPPELGPLQLEISLQDGAMNAQLEAETSAARDLLLQNLPLLQARLRQQDVRLERFEVGLVDHLSDDWLDQASQRRQPRQQRHRDLREPRRRDAIVPHGPLSQSRLQLADVSRIDITI